MKLGIAVVVAALTFLLPGNVLAADNSALLNKPVRVEVPGVGGPLLGRLIAVEGCLYVQFDQKTAEGFTSVRLDQVASMQFTAGQSQPSLEAILKLEPKKCFEEANG